MLRVVMSANPIDSTNTDKPTGSLEELFRHHLAEAAVPPRPLVWEQIDNSLLQHQNEQYRRRLTATRWVAAASIAIASLTGAGWWATRDALQHDRADLAATTQRLEVAEAGQRGRTASQLTAPNRSAKSETLPNQATAANNGPQAQSGAAEASYAAATAPTTASQATTRATTADVRGAARNHSHAATQLAVLAPTTARATHSIDKSIDSQYNATTAEAVAVIAAGAGANGHEARQAAPQLVGAETAATAGVASRSAQAASNQPAGVPDLTSAAARAAVATTATESAARTHSDTNQANETALALNDSRRTEELALLASRTAALSPLATATLPTSFATVEVPADGTPPAVAPARKWQFGASYAVSAFNPNINFSRVGGAAEFDYNPALGPNSPALSEAAAAEYRDNLRPGLSQRLALRATRRLGTRWALSTGAEIAQSRASSASSLAFVGEQVPDFGQQVGGPMRATNFRYQTASVPVELRFANPVKQGLSFYGRVGAAVSALLGVRAEVEGIPEATRSYSIAAEGPYRRVLTNLRGGVGAQYRPATGHCSRWQ